MPWLGHWLAALNWSLTVAVLAIVVGAAVTVTMALVQRKRKGLSCKYTATSLVAVAERSDRLVIAYDGHPVSSASVVRLTLRHSGNDPIRVADFEKPIRLFFGDKASILEYEVVDGSPVNIFPRLELVPIEARGDQGPCQVLDLEPLLLNPDDRFELKVVAENFEGVLVDARIAGVKDVEMDLGERVVLGRFPSPELLGFYFAGAAAGGLATLSIVTDPALRSKIVTNSAIAAVAAVIGVGVFVARVTRSARTKGLKEIA